MPRLRQAGAYVLLLHKRRGTPAPVFTADPSLTGDAIVGSTLTVSLGTASNADSYAGSLRHVSDDTEVATFTADGTYVIQDTDFNEALYLHSVATGPGGVATAESAATGAVGLPTANLQAWWYGGNGSAAEASVSAADGAAVTTWDTKSTPTISPTQGTAANRPLYRQSVSQLNNRGAVEFDGTDDYLVANVAASLVANLTAYCRYVVFRTTDAGGDDYMYSEGRSSSNFPMSAVRSNATAVAAFARSDGNIQVNFTTGAVGANNGAAHLIVLRRVTARRFELWLDNQMVAEAVATSDIGATTIDRLTIGALIRTTIGNYWGGQIALIADYSASDMATIAPILMTHYGITDAADAGAWTWFNDPRAVASGNTLWIGAVNPHGYAKVMTYDLASDTLTTARVLGLLSVDDHDSPSFLVRASDSALLAFYSGHNAASTYLRINTTPGDATAWADAVDLDSQLGIGFYSYTNPIQLTEVANDPIYLFFRASASDSTQWAGYFGKSTDGGATWAAAVKWLDNAPDRPYWKFANNGGDRIDILYTDGHPVSVANNVYHMYYDGTLDTWHKSDGTALGALPLAPSGGTMIWDGSTAAGRAWVWDMKIDGSGNPVAVYAVFPSTTDHRYRYAKWNGTAWDDHEICAAGAYLYAAEAYYSGGVCIDPDNVNVVYASRETGDGVHQIWKYTTADGGATWDAGVQMTSGSDKAFRPYAVGGKLLYVTGTYTSYSNYNTRIVVADL